MTELEVAGMLEQALRDAGSEGFPFPSIVASRAALGAAARPLVGARASGGRLSADGFRRRRRTDTAPTSRAPFVVGTASDEQREVYEVVRVANERGAPAVSGRDDAAGMPTRSRGTTLSGAVTGSCSVTVSATGSGSRCTKRRGWPRTAEGRARRGRGGDDRTGDLSAGVGRRANRGRRAFSARAGPSC